MGERPRRYWRFGRGSGVSVPLHQRLPRGVGSVLAVAFLALSAGTGFVLGGHFEAAQATHGEPRHIAARIGGLGIERITVSGIAELTEAEVLHTAGIDPRISLAFFDAGEARTRLEAHPLVREASVRKLFPNEIAIQLVEREPFALWQRNGEISIIAADGTVIDRLRDSRFAHLPLVVGEGANEKVRDYVQLLQDVGSLRVGIRGATLVSGRRWTMKLENGVDVRLPERGAAEALKRLAKIDREHRLLDRDVLSVDLRQDDRMTMRLTEEAVLARAEKAKARKTGGPA
jgi:cell division protein FtsQ